MKNNTEQLTAETSPIVSVDQMLTPEQIKMRYKTDEREEEEEAEIDEKLKAYEDFGGV